MAVLEVVISMFSRHGVLPDQQYPGAIRMFGWFLVWERTAGCMPRGWTRVLVVAVAAVAAGCATMGGLSKDSPAAEKESAVAERAQARWQALIKGEYETAYAYMSATSRQATSLDRFRARTRSVVFRDAKVRGVVCDADACKADVFVYFDHPRMRGAGNAMEETWVIEQGQAWYVDPIR